MAVIMRDDVSVWHDAVTDELGGWVNQRLG